MYTIYIVNGDETKCIYNDLNPSDDRMVISPKLTLTESNAGELSMKLPPTNIGIEEIQLFSTEIIVKKKGEEIWRGRALNIKEDFNGNKTYTCEGELAYLNDTTQPQTYYEEINVYTLLKTYLDIHNEKSTDDRQFNIGAVSQTDTVSYTYTNYENTLKAISTLVEDYGGYIQLRRDDEGNRVLDWFKNGERPVSPQQIRFGNNLLDFARSFDSTEFCTVVLPLGARLENDYGINMSGIDGVDAYTTIEDVNGDSPYVVNEDSVKVFGWIEKVVHFDDIDDPEELKKAAIEYLTEVQFENITLEINAVDLSYLNVDYQYIRLSEEVRCISKPHGLNMRFPVTKISIPLDNPANTTFTMGYNTKQSMSLQPISAKTNTGDSKTNRTISDITGSLEERFRKYCEDILDSARANANALINAFTRGYITITTMKNGSNELYVTDEPILPDAEITDVKQLCNRYWRWNLNGLAYYDKNRTDYGDPNYIDPADGLMIGITMDGAIVADRITAGTMTAFIIRAGILKSNYGESYWDLDRGILYISNDTVLEDGSTIGTKFNVIEGKISSEISARTAEGENLRSAITQTQDAITAEVSRATNAENTLSSSISIKADEILSTVSDTYVNNNTFQTQIQQTSTSILNSVSANYYTKTEINNKETSINQTMDGIQLKVARSVKTWDTSGYTISAYGFGSPADYPDRYPPYNYSGSYFLDQTSGLLWRSNGTSWQSVKFLKSIQSSLSSEINQTADKIEMKVDKGDVSSQLSIEPSEITIQSNRLYIRADNFKLERDGTIWCQGAEIAGIVKTTDQYGFDMLTLSGRRLSASNDNFVELDNVTDFNYNCTEIRGNYICFSSNGSYVTETQGSTNAKRCLNATLKVYAYKGTSSQRRQTTYLHFKGGLLYSIDDNPYDDFNDGPEY